MQDPVSRSGSSPVLVGVGAAIAIVALLVLQSAASVPFSLRTETTTSTTDLTTTVTATPATTTSTETTISTEIVTSASTSTLSATETTTSISTVTSLYIPPAVLQLQVRLNSTAIRSGGAVAAQITIFNPLGVNVSINPESQPNPSVLAWNARDFACGGSAASNPTWSLAGYALFAGHYTSSNLSSADPLTLYPPLQVSCPARLNPTGVVFLPNSSSMVAYIPPSNFQPPVVAGPASMNASTGVCVLEGYYNCSGSTSLFGYWTYPPGGLPCCGASATTSSPYFHYFPAGEYTLVVEDQWSPAVYSYFHVSGTPPAKYALTVQTNDTEYSGTTSIAISGVVSPPPGPNTAVIVTIRNPQGAAVDISDDAVNATTGAYSQVTVSGGSAGWVAGVYTVYATWGGNGARAANVTTFAYVFPVA